MTEFPQIEQAIEKKVFFASDKRPQRRPEGLNL